MPDPRVEELDAQIDLLETLRDFDAELKDFSSWLDTLTKGPKTGDLAADFEIGQMRDLLLKLSDQLGHYTDPLNQASALAGRISGLVTALDAISTAASNPDAPPDQIITALGDFISGLNSALPLLGRVFGGLNPVVGVYILLLGEMIKGIARSVQAIARQVEVRNDAIDMFDDVIEGRYDLPDQDQVEEDQAQDALEAELTDLYLRRARLERQLRETDYRNALRICLRRRNQNENIYEGDVAELEAHQDEWAHPDDDLHVSRPDRRRKGASRSPHRDDRTSSCSDPGDPALCARVARSGADLAGWRCGHGRRLPVGAHPVPARVGPRRRGPGGARGRRRIRHRGGVPRTALLVHDLGTVVDVLVHDLEHRTPAGAR
ncbi:MAG: hypothetical protein U5K29_13065 [Acidimicrobiales bacterium]|nr:hypothetical protein [Acidimicrobiales bacterium]